MSWRLFYILYIIIFRKYLIGNNLEEIFKWIHFVIGRLCEKINKLWNRAKRNVWVLVKNRNLLHILIMLLYFYTVGKSIFQHIIRDQRYSCVFAFPVSLSVLLILHRMNEQILYNLIIIIVIKYLCIKY